MKLQKSAIAIFALLVITMFAAPDANAQFGGMPGKSKDKVKEKAAPPKAAPVKPADKPKTGGGTTPAAATGDETEARTQNAKNLARAAGMPKAANTDAALNKLLFQTADDHRLIPRRVVVTDKDYLMTTDARGSKVRRIFAVVARTLDDGSGKCGKQMVQFDQDWKEERKAWGAAYVQNIGEITPVACSAIGK